jgi:4-hydroxy-tetrahydrodipicolinate reductase
VNSVLIERFQDASLRRLPCQQKIGAGLDLADFEKKVAEMTIRHVGFSESVQLIAAAMAVPLDRIEERVYPVMATQALRSQFIEIAPGMVSGVDQICQGYCGGSAVITLHLQAYFGHPDPKDRTFIDGEPPLDVTVKGGIPGDTATCAMAVNAVRRIVDAPPGLRTMLDAGVVSSWLSRQQG